MNNLPQLFYPEETWFYPREEMEICGIFQRLEMCGIYHGDIEQIVEHCKQSDHGRK
jgi:hypothetical protein